MTDRLERFENVVGRLSKVAPDAWEGMVAYERVSAVTFCAVMLSAYLGVLILAIAFRLTIAKVKEEGFLGPHDGLSVWTGITLLILVPLLTIAAWQELPKSVATALYPEAALVTKMVGP